MIINKYSDINVFISVNIVYKIILYITWYTLLYYNNEIKHDTIGLNNQKI